MVMKNSAIRDKYKRELFKKLELQRIILKSTIVNQKLSKNQKIFAIEQLAQLPRNSSLTRLKNRCIITNRSRAVYRYFKLSRICLKNLAFSAVIPGVIKSSW